MVEGMVRLTVKVTAELRENMDRWAEELGTTPYSFRSIALALGARQLYRSMLPESFLAGPFKDAFVEALKSGGELTEADVVRAFSKLEGSL